MQEERRLEEKAREEDELLQNRYGYTANGQRY